MIDRPGSRQRVEQIEILERTVEESRRPLTTAAALAFQPQSSVRRSFEQFVYPDPEGRFHLTSERDAGRDASLLYTPSGHNSFTTVAGPPLQQSTPERPTATTTSTTTVNQYGYDVHEVQTNAGGARVSETLGSGQLMLDRSGGPETSTRTPPMAKSILKTSPPPETSWQRSPSSDGSLQRKDSYRRMQDQQEQQQPSFYASSNATIISKGSSAKQPIWSSMFEHRGGPAGGGQLGRMKRSIAELGRQMREGEWSPRLIAVLLLMALFLVLLLLLLWFLVSALFFSPSTFDFWLYPPPCEECQRRAMAQSGGAGTGAGSSGTSPSHLYVHLSGPGQAQFELVGNPPFKSNSFTAVDFDTGFVAIADHALTDDQGRHTSCFLMQLDRSALPDMGVLQDALEHTFGQVHSQFGWQEYWQYNVEEVDRSFVSGKFRQQIDDCTQARWYLLKHAVYTRDSSCSYCYDFCLPDYAVLRRQKYEDTVSLGIRRLNCFRLYVPEWSKYQVQTDAYGGNWHYPMHSLQNTQRDARGRWVDWRYEAETPQTSKRRRKRKRRRRR